MEKYKICPTCGTKNPPTILECIQCETDLTGVSIGDVIQEIQAEGASHSTQEGFSAEEMVRICECGAHNPASARKCISCGEDISDIMPVSHAQGDGRAEGGQYILSSQDGRYAYALVDNLTIIGRDYTMGEYLSGKAFVSRKHAELLIEAGKLWIKNHSTTNRTYVNNQLIKDNGYAELHDGDVIGLGGKTINGQTQDEAAYFIVRSGSCT